jgi:prevent-host-death family protein
VEVGVRDLKNNLCRYLARVGTGTEIIITDRGRAVARITPVNTETTINRLIAQGVVTPAPLTKQVAPTKRVHPKEPISSLVADQRR